MSAQFGPKRPLGVTIVAVLAVVAGVFDVIGGIALLAVQGDAAAADRLGGVAVLVSLAVFSFVTGIVMLLIAWGLLRGNATARIAATVVQGFSLASSLWIGFTQPAMLATEIVSALIALALLMLLWSGEASRYFSGSLAPDEPAR